MAQLHVKACNCAIRDKYTEKIAPTTRDELKSILAQPEKADPLAADPLRRQELVDRGAVPATDGRR